MAQAAKSLDGESSIDGLVRPAYFVPETKDLGGLLAEMRDNNQHMVVVIDEFGGVAGIVTLEQLVEEIVGSIGDELAGGTKEFITIDDNTFEVDGGLDVEEANEELSLELPTGEYQTVAGFILSHLGRIPKQGAQFKYRNLKFVISQMRGMKIEKVVVTKESDAAPAS
jgi:CBS domain containing-hemolysin-like protein